MSIGKIRITLKNNKRKKLIKLLTRVAKLKVKLWRIRRTINAKKNIVKILTQFSNSPTLILFLKYTEFKLIKIQRWMKRVYTKQRLLLAIMNKQWSVIEYAITRVRNSNKESLQNSIANCIKNNNNSDIVPIVIRIFYIKKFLKVIEIRNNNNLRN